jgi:hypothetical protein
MLDFLGEDTAAARVHKAISGYVEAGTSKAPLTTVAIGDAIADRL